MLILFCLLFSVNYGTYGHTDNLQSEAELQSALMPQELNPAFVPEKVNLLTAKQWNTVLPTPRSRRSTELTESVEPQSPVGEHVKHYGRIVALVVLVISAVSEVVLYCISVFYNI